MTRIKLTPIRKTGRQMLEELGYRKREVSKQAETVFFVPGDGKQIIITPGNYFFFSDFDKPRAPCQEEILALAQMIKDGEFW